jgi:hypothetical protein
MVSRSRSLQTGTWFVNRPLCQAASYEPYVGMRFKDRHRPPDRRCGSCERIAESENR